MGPRVEWEARWSQTCTESWGFTDGPFTVTQTLALNLLLSSVKYFNMMWHLVYKGVAGFFPGTFLCAQLCDERVTPKGGRHVGGASGPSLHLHHAGRSSDWEQPLNAHQVNLRPQSPSQVTSEDEVPWV